MELQSPVIEIVLKLLKTFPSSNKFNGKWKFKKSFRKKAHSCIAISFLLCKSFRIRENVSQKVDGKRYNW